MQKTSPKYNKSITKKLIISVVLFSAFITLITSSIQIYGNYKRDISSIEKRFEEIKQVHIPSLATRVWIADREELKFQLESIYKLPDIQYISVTENESTENETSTSVGEKTDDNMILQSYPIYFEHRGENIQIGVLHVQATLDNVYQHIIDQAIIIILSNAIKTFLVSGFILILFFSLVTRHLNKMATFASQLDVSKLDEKLQLDRKPPSANSHDELESVVHAFDIMQSNLRESIDKLRNNEEHYRTLVETTTAIPWELDAKTMLFTYVGPQAVKVLGYPVEDWYKKGFWEDHIYEEDKEQAVGFCIYETEQGNNHDFEYRMLKSDGSLIWIQDYVQVTRDKDRAVTLSGFMFDVSRRKKIEAELEIHQTHLEELIQQRTGELELSNQELESYSYSIAHDLRAPLRAMSSFSQLVLSDAEERLTDQETDYLNRVVTAAKDMARMINDILELSRVTRRDIVLKNIDLTSMANNIITKLYTNNDNNQKIIHWNIQSGLSIRGDVNLITAAITNLLSNARKYSQNTDAPSVTFSSEMIDDETIYCIEDNGVGFDMRYVNKLFTPFQRLHTADEFDGNGIGLATVERIIKRHGGRVWATSELDAGSKFYFTLTRSVINHSTEQHGRVVSL